MSDDISKLDLYTAVRNQILHEDDLFNQRFTWVLSSTGFSTAGFFLLLGSLDKFELHKVQLGILLFSICLFGIISSALILIEIRKSRRAYVNLRNFWYERYPNEGSSDGFNYLNAYPHKELPDVHHSIPLPGNVFLKAAQRGASIIGLVLIVIWLAFSAVSVYIVWDPYNATTSMPRKNYPIIRRSTLGKDTSIYIDTLYAPK